VSDRPAFMPRKPLDNEVRHVRLFGQASPVRDAVDAQKHADRGSLSRGPWNKCGLMRTIVVDIDSEDS
jgi:hypothetical protein